MNINIEFVDNQYIVKVEGYKRKIFKEKESIANYILNCLETIKESE